MRLLLLLSLMLVTAPEARGQQRDSTTTIILVRHAEKAAEPAADPPLTAEGEARAKALVEAVRSAGLTAIYSTATIRTQTTAGPVARALGLTVTTFNPPANSTTYGESYAREVLGKHRGGVVLIVGHSNTLPPILRALGVAPRVPPGAPPMMSIADPIHDLLFIVTIPTDGSPRVVEAKYGAPSVIPAKVGTQGR